MSEMQCDECFNAVKSELKVLAELLGFNLDDDKFIDGAIRYYCHHGVDSRLIAKTLFNVALEGCNNKTGVDATPTT